MEKRGQISVFLSLVLVCISSLVLGLTETARTAGARWYLQMAADSSLSSVMSQYHRKLWEQYRLMYLELESEDEILADFRAYITPYLEVKNWYPNTEKTLQIETLELVTDEGGRYMEQEILDYMKYGIWELDFPEDTVTEVWTHMKEAGALEEISSAYGSHTREAVRLEKSIEALDDALGKQKNIHSAGLGALESGDGDRFCSEGKKLRRELHKIPSLVKDYEKKADQLREKLRTTVQQCDTPKESLSSSVRDALEGELQFYGSYTEKDGERRQEICSLAQSAVDQEQYLDQTLAQVEEVEEIIDSWDDDDEDEDDHDPQELWDDVASDWGRYPFRELNCPHGIRDKEKQGWLEQIGDIVSADLLKLVLPETSVVSGGTMDQSQFPSHTSMGQGDTLETSLPEHVLVNEYCDQYFTDFLSIEEGADKKIWYELEYLLGEKDSDRENLQSTIIQILMLREGMNLVHILTSAEKRAEARALAAAIVGATGIAPLVMVMEFFIMGVWALGESVADLRALMAGGKISLFKTAQTWSLDLDGLLELGKSHRIGQNTGQESGLTYQGYIKMLLLLKTSQVQYYEMMDIIQMNMRREQPGFLMNTLAYRVDIQGTYGGKHIFSSLGIVDNPVGGMESGYEVEILTGKAY